MINLKFTDFKNLTGIQLKWKNLYIDASHPNETRIVLKSNNSIEEYEFEDKNNLTFKNNIYLGTISRVEPSLQASFYQFWKGKTWFFSIQWYSIRLLPSSTWRQRKN